jgi:coenzyme Q-binding protein COQ10
MSKAMLRTLRPTSALHSFRHQCQARRSFITLPGTEPQSLSATRILPYKSTSLYTLIADVDNYSTFLPYCLDSKVTKWSRPDKDGQRWPSEADLKVGWAGYEETFTSRLFCVPGSVVEALGGEAVTSLAKSDLSHHSETLDAPAAANNIFQTISTRWTVKPFHYKPPTINPQTDKTQHPARDQTEVHLTLDFQFSNPIYAALSKAVAPKVAGIMIEAFEVRARKLLDGPGAVMQEKTTLDHAFNAGKRIGV